MSCLPTLDVGMVDDDARGLRVLGVDDEPLMRRAVELAAADSGAWVETADSTEEARRRIEQGVFDWIVCDYRLRYETSGGFVRELLASGRRVVLLTGDASRVEPNLGVRIVEKPVLVCDL